MSESINKEALERATLILESYFEKSHSKQLDAKIQGWLASDGHRAEKDAALGNIWNRIVEADMEPGKYAYSSLEQVRRRLGFPSEEVSRRRRRLRVASRIAAVVIPCMVMAAALYLWRGYYARQAEIQAPVADHTEQVVGSEEYLVLPDGSEVWLKEGTRITYSSDFSRERIVHLNGEAYFSVVHNGLPFEVKSENLDVHVLGTEFGMIAYDGGEISEVTLAKGAVEVVARDKTIVLEPLEQFIYNTLSAQMTLRQVDDDDIAQWRRNDLDFRGATLAEVFRALSNHYQREFAIDDRLPLDNRIRVKFDREEELDKVLSVIQKTIGTFKYEVREDGKVVITRL